jgi:hypothetical protein
MAGVEAHMACIGGRPSSALADGNEARSAHLRKEEIMVDTKILGMTASALLAALTASPAFARGQGDSSPQATDADRAPESLRSSPQKRTDTASPTDDTGKRPTDDGEGIPGYYYRTAGPTDDTGKRPTDDGEGLPGY